MKLIHDVGFNRLAQQNTETPRGPDADTISLDAKAAAEQDASNDFRQLSWLSIGAGVGITGCAVGAVAGCCIGAILNPVDTEDPSAFFFQISSGLDFGCLTGGAVGILAPLIGIYRYPVHPPSQRLIGKSPEYVELYTDTYKRKTRSLRVISAAAGTAPGCGLMAAFLIF